MEPEISKDQKEEAENLLLHRQAKTSASNILKEVFVRLDRKIEELAYPTTNAKLLDETTFERNNRQLQLTYIPEVWNQIKALASEVLPNGDWNGSISKLYKVSAFCSFFNLIGKGN